MASLVVLKQLRFTNVLRSKFAGSLRPAVATDVSGQFSLARRMHHESVSLTIEETEPRSFKREDAERIYLFVEMPGIPRGNVDVTVDQRDVVIEGEVVKDYQCECRNYSTRIYLPENIKANGIKANMKDGLLKVTLPKLKEIKQEEEEETISEFKVMVN